MIKYDKLRRVVIGAPLDPCANRNVHGRVRLPDGDAGTLEYT